MEVVVPVMAPSAPCSPRTAAIAGGDHLPGYCYFFSSAPTSPSRASYAAGDASPGVGVDDATTFDFTLGFSGQLQEATPTIAAADELFEGGRIRPLNTPHPSILLVDVYDSTSSSSSFSSSFTTGGARSPRRIRTTAAARGGGDHRQSEAAALETTRGRSSGRPTAIAPASAAASSSRTRSRRATRSLSPFRGGVAGVEDDDEFPSSPPSPRTSMMRGCGSGSKKWRLKDFFLFRSASEGRATTGGKDPLFKYTMLKSGGDGGSASMRKGRGSAASASDMPYAMNRAAAGEEMRRRTTATTPLPFHRNSLFGYLRSNPAIHSISRKLGSQSSSNRSRPI
ncbi:hypothetical protein HU200_046044 [Digitaria exilis]|uniref:Pheromone receptor n=1 Tax=Digitaria exilis TaxID=1010633 RepID=A0A835B750_9POAL|nr:hypothetical protein HU200_046044 [Digitaria exilis]CAB3458634.1 unnamed protein product [Digitaria exilis]